MADTPNIPRDLWQSHPNYPYQTLLLRSHDGFRRLSRQLLRSARDARNSGGDTSSLKYVFVHWKLAMKSHERYEERKLYPYLAARFGASMNHLERQHEQLGHIERGVFAAWDSDDDDALVDALEAHDRLLVEHLAEEEESVIPWLLSMARDEFDHYAHSSARTLLRELSGTQR